MSNPAIRPYRPIIEVGEWSDHVGLFYAHLPLPLAEQFKGSVFGAYRNEDSDRARDAVVRAAAFETGAVEDLYEARQGATITIATEADGWETELAEAGNVAPDRFKDQLDAYNLAISIAETRGGVITETDIRHLHECATRSQLTYQTADSFGTPITRELHHGGYKREPNYTTDRAGAVKAYAPPSDVAAELQEALREYNRLGDTVRDATLMSAYIHWAVAHIHPFEDGNGRTARLIASIPLVAATGLPYVLFADRKQTYYQDLDQADGGNTTPFFNHTSRRNQATHQLWLRFQRTSDADTANQLTASARILAAQSESPEDLDAVAQRVASYLDAKIDETIDALPLALDIEVKRQGPPFHVAPTASYAQGVVSATSLLSARTLAHLDVEANLFYQTARAPSLNESWSVRITTDGPMVGFNLELRYEDCTPELSTEAQLFLDDFAAQLINQIAHDLRKNIEDSVRAAGNMPPTNH